MDTNFADHPFVKFVDQLTTQPAVKTALHRLRSPNGANINIILYAIWCGHNQRGRFLRQDLKKLLSAVHSWHECVSLALQRSANIIDQSNFKPIKKLKTPIDVELKITNQIEQRLIAETLIKFNSYKRNPAQQLSDACHNITGYCNFLRFRIDEEDRKAIGILLQAAFPNLIAAEIAEACENSLTHSTTPPGYAQLKLNEF